jgi:hypothetical protein
MYAVLFCGRMSLFETGVEVSEFLRTLLSIFGGVIRASIMRLTEMVSDPSRLPLIALGIDFSRGHRSVAQ